MGWQPTIRVLAALGVAVAGYALGVHLEQRRAEAHLGQVERWRAQVAERERALACALAADEAFEAGREQGRSEATIPAAAAVALAHPSLN